MEEIITNYTQLIELLSKDKWPESPFQIKTWRGDPDLHGGWRILLPLGHLIVNNRGPVLISQIWIGLTIKKIKIQQTLLKTQWFFFKKAKPNDYTSTIPFLGAWMARQRLFSLLLPWKELSSLLTIASMKRQQASRYPCSLDNSHRVNISKVG